MSMLTANRDTFVASTHSNGGYHRQCRDNPDAAQVVWELQSALASYRGVADLVLGHACPPPHEGELEAVSATSLFCLLDVLNDNLHAVCELVEQVVESSSEVAK